MRNVSTELREGLRKGLIVVSLGWTGKKGAHSANWKSKLGENEKRGGTKLED